MARHERPQAGKDGWTDWIFPIMDGYKMSCCDCGLVHRMKFTALSVIRKAKDGSWTGKPINKGRVSFKISRDERATAAVRREARKRLK